MLQHILATAADAANRQFEVLDRISHNVANINTTGYKVKRFEQYLRVDGEVDGIERTDTAQALLQMTKRPLDVGIEGAGYLTVTQSDGTQAYTRDGSFTKSPEGLLITARGDIVGSGIQLPAQYHKVFIQKNGDVQVMDTPVDEPRTVGTLSLVTFANPEALHSIGGNKLIPTEDSGTPQSVDAGVGTLGGEIRQGFLERSNVNMYHQIDQVLRLNASVISNMRVAKFTDDLYRQAVNLRQ
ncbi:MAG: flagellar hook basal-body protein [Vampirovibrionales bacterium]